jgi:pilus assembly protein Flp/PilA
MQKPRRRKGVGVLCHLRHPGCVSRTSDPHNVPQTAAANLFKSAHQTARGAYSLKIGRKTDRPFYLPLQNQSVKVPGVPEPPAQLGQEIRTMSLITRFLRDDSGATAIEYGLIAAGISVAIIATVTSLGGKLVTTFGKVNTALN